MDLKGLRVPIKILLLIFSLFFTACSLNSKVQPYTLDKERSDACKNELKQTISSLIDARNLSISEDIFSTTSLLYLNNQKNGILIKSPIINDLKGRKTLMLYKKDNKLYIGLINQKKEILKAKKLQKCLCSF